MPDFEDAHYPWEYALPRREDRAGQEELED